MSVDANFESGYGEERAFEVGGQFFDVGELVHGLYDVTVDIGAIGFHDVVGEAVCVVSVVVMDTEGGEESATDQGAGDNGTKDGIAIVEKAVGIIAFAFASEVVDVGQKVAPIEGCGTAFEVGAVARMNVGSPLLHVACLAVV